MPYSSIYTGLILMLALCVTARAQSSEADVWAQKIYNFSSISATVSQSAGQVDQMLAESSGEYEADEYAELSRIMNLAFREEDLKRDVLVSIASNIHADTAQAVLDWLTQPLTMRMQKMEAAGIGDEAKLNAFLQNLDMQDADVVERINTLQGLMDVSGGAEVMADMVVAMMKGMLMAGQLNADADEQMSDEEIDAQIAVLKQQMLPQFQQSVIVMMLFAYRNAPTMDLKEYVAYYHTPEGAWYNRATSSALKYAFGNVGARMGQQIGLLKN